MTQYPEDARVKLAIWAAWRELNEIWARDGLPYTHLGYEASIDEDYFSSVVDELADLLGADAKPWPAKRWLDQDDAFQFGPAVKRRRITMVSLNQVKAGHVLSDKGLTAVGLPHTPNTPIPGLILYADEGHRHLWKVQGDGIVVDLLAVFHAAEDCVRNWHKGDKLNLPHFTGDFGRLAKLAEALNGRKPDDVDG